MSSEENEKWLIIRDVVSSDVGLFTMEEQFSRQTALVNLVVIGKLSAMRGICYGLVSVSVCK